jgi:O-antigen/teichoic acid export membrane protein
MSATFRNEGNPVVLTDAPVANLGPSGEYALKLRRNSVSGVCRVAVLTAVYFLTYPYMLHHLGTERFGMWALALVVSQSLGTQDLGISGALMSFIPVHWNTGGSARIRELASTAIFLLAAMGMLLGIGVFFFRNELVSLLKIPTPLRNEMSWLLVGMAVVFFLNLLSSGLTAILIGIHRMDISNVTYTAAAIVQAGGVFLVLHRGYGLLGLTVSYVCTAFLWGLTTWILLHRCLPDFRLRASLIRRADAVSLLRYGSNIQAAGLGSFLTVPPIKILLSRYVSLASVSSFELASGMAMQLRSVFLMAAMPLIPASAHFNSEKAVIKLGLLYRQSLRYIVLVALPVFSVAAVLSPGFTEFWLRKGTPYVASTLVLLLVGWFLNTLILPAYFMLQGQGFARYQVYVASIQAVCSALFGYTLVQLFGYYGAITGLVIGLSVAAVYLLWQYPRLCPEGAGRLVDKSLLVAVVVNAILLFPFIFKPHWRQIHHPLGLALLTIAYLSAYVLLLVSFGCLSQTERKGIKSLWSSSLVRFLKKRHMSVGPPQLEHTAVVTATKWGEK